MHGAENDAPWIEVDVTIEITTEEKGRYKIDRRDFEEWAGDVEPADMPKRLREYLRAGEEWDVCAEVYENRHSQEVVDCEVRSVEVTSYRDRS